MLISKKNVCVQLYSELDIPTHTKVYLNYFPIFYNNFEDLKNVYGDYALTHKSI